MPEADGSYNAPAGYRFHWSFEMARYVPAVLFFTASTGFFIAAATGRYFAPYISIAVVFLVGGAIAMRRLSAAP
jgi:hypothetical protein